MTKIVTKLLLHNTIYIKRQNINITIDGVKERGVRDLPAQHGLYLVRELQRKLNLLLTLFRYPFFHMCLPALPASLLTSLCHLKYSVLFFKFALFSSLQ